MYEILYCKTMGCLPPPRDPYCSDIVLPTNENNLDQFLFTTFEIYITRNVVSHFYFPDNILKFLLANKLLPPKISFLH